MTIPLSARAPGISKTTLLSMEAIRKRLENRSWVIRPGIPDISNLPDDGAQAISVWYFPNLTRGDEEGQSTNWGKEVFQTSWVITIVTGDTGSDPHATDPTRIVEATGEVLEALTLCLEDKSLDNSVNWSDNYSAQYGIATVGGDRACLVASIRLNAHHPIFPVRLPPGL